MRTLSLVVLLLPACRVACDDFAAASVVVHLVDEEGDPAAPDSLTYTVDGGPVERPVCDDPPCTDQVLAWEQPGLFEVTAERCGRTVTETVRVEADACHVTTEEVTLVLPACATGAVEIAYAWSGFFDEVTTCAQAGAADLYVFGTVGGAAFETRRFACDDAPLLVDGLRTGSAHLQVATVSSPADATNPFAASLPVDVPVLEGQTATTSVTLVCDENGWDDGCGGA